MKNLEFIQNFFEKLKCNECDNYFSKDSVQLLRNEENNVVVRIKCAHCGKNLGLAILGLDKTEYKNSLKMENHNESEPLNTNIPDDPITYDDVMEAHKFFSDLGSDWTKYLPGRDKEK